MNEEIKFPISALRRYMQVGFMDGQPFKPQFGGDQLVKTERSGGVFVAMDVNGAPQLSDEFVEHMDSTTFELCFDHDRIKSTFESLRRPDGSVEYCDQHSNCLYSALYWLCFLQVEGRTAEWMAEQKGVDRATVFRWVNEGLKHIAKGLTAKVDNRPAMPLPEFMMKAA